MATWHTYLRIAENIKTRVEGIELQYLMLGFVAPFLDNYKEADLRQEDMALPSSGIADINTTLIENRLMSFKKRYIEPPLILYKSDSKRSFLWGYYFNLLVTLLWLRMFENNKDIDGFAYAWDIYDFEYLSKKGYALLEELDEFEPDENKCENCDIFKLIKFKKEIVKYYCNNRSIINSDNIKEFNSEIIEEFIKKAEALCVNHLFGKA